VKGHYLWEKSQSNAPSAALAGMKFDFKQFVTVVELEENMRLN
jgi:hypothetical protein